METIYNESNYNVLTNKLPGYVMEYVNSPTSKEEDEVVKHFTSLIDVANLMGNYYFPPIFQRKTKTTKVAVLLKHLNKITPDQITDRKSCLLTLAMLHLYGSNINYLVLRSTLTLIPIMEKIYSLLGMEDKVYFIHLLWKNNQIFRVLKTKYCVLWNGKIDRKINIGHLSFEEKKYVVDSSSDEFLKDNWKSIAFSFFSTRLPPSLTGKYSVQTEGVELIKSIIARLPGFYDSIGISKLWHIYFCKIIPKKSLPSFFAKLKNNKNLSNEKFQYLADIFPDNPFVRYVVGESSIGLHRFKSNELMLFTANFVEETSEPLQNYVGKIFPVNINMIENVTDPIKLEYLLRHHSVGISCLTIEILNSSDSLRVLEKMDYISTMKLLARVFEDSDILKTQIKSIVDSTLTSFETIIPLVPYLVNHPEIVTPDHHHYITYNIYRYFFFDVPVEFFVPEEKADDLHVEISKFVKEKNMILTTSFLNEFCMPFFFYQINGETRMILLMYLYKTQGTYWNLDESRCKYKNHPDYGRFDVVEMTKSHFIIKKFVLLVNLFANIMNQTESPNLSEWLLSLKDLILTDTLLIKNKVMNLCLYQILVILQPQRGNVREVYLFLTSLIPSLPKELINFLLSSKKTCEIVRPFLFDVERESDFNNFESKFQKIYADKHRELTSILNNVNDDAKEFKEYLQKQLDNLKNQVLKDLMYESQYIQCNICYEYGEKRFFTGFSHCTHYSCITCAKNLSNCPECRVEIGNKRTMRSESICYFVDQINDRIKVPNVSK